MWIRELAISAGRKVKDTLRFDGCAEVRRMEGSGNHAGAL